MASSPTSSAPTSRSRPPPSTPAPQAVEALFNGALDATYIGPNPAINAFAQSQGQAVRIISGATSGGAALVVKPEIADAAGLAGKKLATPQRGNTQDVALRAWLSDQGFKTDLEGGGDVSIVPQENAQTLETFRSGAIDGAWVPEPWVSRLVNEGGGKVLVDEASLWPGGQFVTTHLIVRTEFLKDHPAAVRKLLEAQVAANEFVNTKPAEAKALANQGIEKITQKPLSTALHRLRLAQAHLHQRPDRLLAGALGPPRHRRTACSRRSTSTASTT